MERPPETTKRNKQLGTALAVILSLVSFTVVGYVSVNPYHHVKWNSRLSLDYLGGKIDQHHADTGRFPRSLTALETYVVDVLGENWGPHAEYISDPQGNGRESSTLDGKGGWYYNKETGRIRVNLDKPLKHYLRFYYLPDRNQHPCDW